MITNDKSNLLFLADTLGEKFPAFSQVLTETLNRCDIRTRELPGTKDIWCRDYMPVQIGLKNFVQFSYPPPYLQGQKYLDTITDVNTVCSDIGIQTKKSDIILDGGNIVCSEKKATLTDRVIKDNPGKSKTQLFTELRNQLELDEIIIIPAQPRDMFGHADGMLRFIDEDTVLVNDFSGEKDYFRKGLSSALNKHKLKQVGFTYSPSSEKNADKVPSASGTYINFLHIGNQIIMPTFDIPEDEIAFMQLCDVYTNHHIETIDSSEIAKEGGVLNCIAWNVKYWIPIFKDFGDFYMVMNE